MTAHLRTDTDTPVDWDVGDYDPIPPEAWRYCGGVAHLVKRRVIQQAGHYQTVAVCAKCHEVVETLEHPVATPGRYR
jgi:hypothetical protein